MASKRPVYNYDVESAAIGNCSLMALVPADRLPGLLERHPELANCHHYAICRRPRISVRPLSLQGDLLALQFSADHGDGEPALSEIEIPMQVPSGAHFDDSAFPGVVRILGSDDSIIFEEPAAGLLTAIMSSADRDTRLQWDLDYLDLNVAYVGQALGPSKGRSAADRLVSHSTLQQILADTLTHKPHLDVWIVMMAFDAFSTLSAFGPWEGSLGSTRSEEHLENLLDSPLSGVQLTNLVEGALISHFQPTYNRYLKHSFPLPTHGSYGDVYTLDYNAAGFELDTRSIFTRLGSESVAPEFFHTGVFPLHDETTRRAFFDWYDNPEVANALLTRKKKSSATE